MPRHFTVLICLGTTLAFAASGASADVTYTSGNIFASAMCDNQFDNGGGTLQLGSTTGMFTRHAQASVASGGAGMTIDLTRTLEGVSVHASGGANRGSPPLHEAFAEGFAHDEFTLSEPSIVKVSMSNTSNGNGSFSGFLQFRHSDGELIQLYSSGDHYYSLPAGGYFISGDWQCTATSSGEGTFSVTVVPEPTSCASLAALLLAASALSARRSQARVSG